MTESRLLETLKQCNPDDVMNIPALREKLTPEQMEGLYEFIEHERATKDPERHELRMRECIDKAAKAVGLRWSATSPVDHPFGARLDGSLWLDKKRVAVVELEAKNRKQIAGALLDLLTHPESNKILLVGRSKTEMANQLKKKLVTEVLPTVQALLKVPAAVAIFTETELHFRPKLLSDFLGLQPKV